MARLACVKTGSGRTPLTAHRPGPPRPTRGSGGAVFFVSNDRTGTLSIEGSTLTNNPSDGFQSAPGIFYLGTAKDPQISGSTIS